MTNKDLDKMTDEEINNLIKKLQDIKKKRDGRYTKSNLQIGKKIFERIYGEKDWEKFLQVAVGDEESDVYEFKYNIVSKLEASVKCMCDYITSNFKTEIDENSAIRPHIRSSKEIDPDIYDEYVDILNSLLDLISANANKERYSINFQNAIRRNVR